MHDPSPFPTDTACLRSLDEAAAALPDDLIRAAGDAPCGVKSARRNA